MARLSPEFPAGTMADASVSAAVKPGQRERLWVRFAWLLPLALFAATLALPSQLVTRVLPWVPVLGVELAFAVDGLSRLFLLLVAGVGVAVFYYAPGYLHGHPRVGYLMGLLTAFMAAMAGAVVADDLLLLFLFWEATSVLSFLLIGFDHEKKISRDSALHALLITAGGGLALLAGIVLISQAAPDLRLSTLARLDPAVLADPRFQAGAALVLLGAMTKSAQFPFHFWLPGAMAAPTPVSAYLHSATMVNLGVYVLARFDEAMGAVAWWASTLTVLGSTTAVWGALQSLRERDLKRILAWSTVSALGTLTLLIGLPNELGALAFVAFVLAHALYKAPLFFVSGNVDHVTGTRIIDNLRGLGRDMPITAAAAVLAGLSMAGLPSSVGFIAKDTIKAAKELSDAAWLVGVSGLLVSAVSVAVASVAAGRVFFGRGSGDRPPIEHHETPRLHLPPLMLAATGIALGLFPALAEALLFEAARVIAPSLEAAHADLGAEWLVRAESVVVVLALGAAIYAAWNRLHRFLEALRFLDRIGPASLYDFSLASLKRIAGALTRRLQAGRLSRYLLITAGGAVLITAPWALDLAVASLPLRSPVGIGVVLGCVTAVAGVALAVSPGDTLQRLLGTGAVGLGSAVVFLFLGGPDLALTQLAVETVFVVVAAVTLVRYRALNGSSSGAAARASVALAFGALLAALLFRLMQQPLDDRMTRYFLENSVPNAHGHNVVNVIIVDFRALDTLGEIAAVMFAALASWPLLRRLQHSRANPLGNSVLIERTVSLLYWPMLLAAGWFLLRGHNAPGGGFIAALVAISATSAYAFAFGADAARIRMPLRPLALSALGLALTATSGLPALAVGEPFLTHLWGEVAIASATVKLSTVLLFDLGVMLCVWGAMGGFCLRLLEAERCSSW